MELIRVWFNIIRREELDRALGWYDRILSKINQEARQTISFGKDSRQPSESEILRKTATLKKKYFRLVPGQEWKKLAKEDYFNVIVQQKAFLNKCKSEKRKNIK